MIPKVSIIILNWNGYEYTRDCLNSLKNIIYDNYEIIIVDNASTDNSVELLTNEFNNYLIIENKSNLGFAAGNNVGIRKALENGADYILLLNNDTLVKEDFLNISIDFAENNKKTAILSGKIHYFPEKKRGWYEGAYIKTDLLSLFRGPIIVNNNNNKITSTDNKPRKVSFITGAMMLIRRTLIEDIGCLPEAYFFRMEDLDYCLQAHRKGYTLMYLPGVIIWHNCQNRSNRTTNKYIYNDLRNKIIFHQRNLPTEIWFLWKIIYSVYYKIIARIIYPLKFEKSSKMKIKAALLAMRNHHLNSKVNEEELNTAFNELSAS